jgi:hypothetical protein
MCALSNPQSADHIAAAAGTFEPQRQNNFSVEVSLGSADRDLIVMGLHGFTLPTQSNDIVEVEFQNEKRKVAGQVTVDEGSLVLKDFVDADTRGAILRWRKLVYDVQTGNIGLASSYKKTANVVMTGPDGSSTRVAKLVGAWPSADPAVELSSEGAEKLLMEVPIQVDKIDWSRDILGA